MAATAQGPVAAAGDNIEDAIEAKFHELFDAFVLQLSEHHFKQLFDTMKSGDSTLIGNPILANFKSRLLAKIKQDFSQFWQDYQVADCLALLRDTRALTKADAPEEGWRPTAKTPLDQTRFFRVFVLRNKIAFIQKQMPSQQQSMNNIIIRLEQQRDRMKEIESRRQSLSARIHQRLKEEQCQSLVL